MNEGFWKRICGLAGSALTRERWCAELADAFPLLECCLEKTGRPVRHTKADACGSNHKIVPDESGDGFVSVCEVAGGCESRAMTADEARAWILSGKALAELVGRALPVAAKVRAIGSHGLWEIGSVWLRSGGKKTLCVAVVGKPVGLEAGLADLFEQGLRDFVLLVPDSEWCGGALATRLGAVGGEAYGLDECVEIRDGKLCRGVLAEKTFAEGAGRRRSILAGNTSYTGVPLADIVDDLREWEQTTKQECEFLREKQAALQKVQAEIPQETFDAKFESDMTEWERKTREMKMSREMVEFTRPFLAKYSDIIGFIGAMAENHERFALEFGRLVQELPRGVKASHAEALRQILVRCDSLNDRCRVFREDYVTRGPWIEVATAVYNEVLDTHGDYMDLGNVALRLDALVGSTMEMSGAVSGSVAAEASGITDDAVPVMGSSPVVPDEMVEAVRQLNGKMDRVVEKADMVIEKGFEAAKQSKALSETLAKGILGWVEKIEPDDFRILTAILSAGDVSKAAVALKRADSTVRTIVESWGSKGGAYRTLPALVLWRKKVGGKYKVPFNDAIDYKVTPATDYPRIMRGILTDLEEATDGNLSEVVQEVIDLLREEVPR